MWKTFPQLSIKNNEIIFNLFLSKFNFQLQVTQECCAIHILDP